MLNPGTNVFCRYNREAFTVVHCNGIVTVVRDANGAEAPILRANITTRAPN